MSANEIYTHGQLRRIEEVMARAIKGVRGYSMQAAAMFLSREMPHSAGSIYATYMKLKQEDYGEP
jgi:hypothetical protein